ncbi:MAG: helix-turn-helix transcriptional regulator, partial [Bacteroidales bacterium]|nr:helix-turn-helix transcriptional regulator [Bacteroidales bacterium]
MDEKTVKQRIKAYRKQSKLSQKEIADQIGISRNAYIGIENGDT